VRGRKLDAIRAKLGSHGAHLRVNHQLVDADEVGRLPPLSLGGDGSGHYL
jgi:hypothetical protein